MQQQQITRVTKYCIPGVTLTPRGDHWQIRKIGLTAERVKEDPAFAKTRKKAKEFGRAIQFAQKLGGILTQATGIRKIMPRLTGRIVKVMQGNTTGMQEGETLVEGDWQMLEGFEGNPQQPWKEVISYPYQCRYNREQQEITVHFPAHKPAACMQNNGETTHYRIRLIVIKVDEAGQVSLVARVQSTLLPYKPITIPQLNLTASLIGTGRRLYIAVLHLQWYKPGKNGCLVADKKLGALTIIGTYKCA